MHSKNAFSSMSIILYLMRTKHILILSVVLIFSMNHLFIFFCYFSVSCFCYYSFLCNRMLIIFKFFLSIQIYREIEGIPEEIFIQPIARFIICLYTVFLSYHFLYVHIDMCPSQTCYLFSELYKGNLEESDCVVIYGFLYI